MAECRQIPFNDVEKILRARTAAWQRPLWRVRFWLVLRHFENRTAGIQELVARALVRMSGGFCALSRLLWWPLTENAWALVCCTCSTCICLALHILFVTHIFATQCWRAPIRAKQLSTVATSFIGSCHVGVSKRFSRSISLALSLYFFFFFGGGGGWSGLLQILRWQHLSYRVPCS